MNKLTTSDIKKLFNLLNAELTSTKTKGELYLVGGAVFCLVYNSRASTIDVDAFFKPAKEIRVAASKVALDLGVNEDWLNDGVKGFLGSNSEFHRYLELSNLKIMVAEPKYLFAMKCLSFRIGEEFHDIEDIKFLLKYLGINNFDEAIEVITKFYPEDLIPQKTFYGLRELIEGAS